MPISRRQLLANVTKVAGGMSLALDAQPPKRLKVIVTGGHPGDPEYGCGGTVAKYADQGHEVVLLYLNRGERTCPAPPTESATNVRVAEAKRACEILKARPLFAPQCDAHAVVDAAQYDEFRKIIASEKP